MKFSVIVPVYNVADYLPKCLRSLLAQDCDDWELILVDDGSTDGKCPELCDEYAAAEPELIRVIHQANGGLGAARNTGLEAAAGEYLLFVDSDDTIAPDTLSRLSEEIDKTHADMYIFSFRYVQEDGTQSPAEPRNDARYGVVTSLKEQPELLLDPPMAWARLCRASLFTETGIRFPGRVWYEDLCTTPSLLRAAKTIVQLPDPFYGYLIRQGSIMRSSNLKRNLEILNALDMARAPFDKAGETETYKPWLSLLAVTSVLDAARRVLLADPKADYLPDFLDYVKKNYPDYRENELLPRLGKKKLVLLRLLESGQYRLAKTLFALAGKLK
ncbi:MAG: glycosyltransferase family 2 protein [Oscillospiraceae bacterium]|nr:glycosyltransferase family 2 protein [Oscillospiraceae bacterium]